MRRGDIYWVDLEPARETECNKRRPAVIVSNDAGNRAAARRGAGVVTVVPLTSNTKKVYSFQVFLSAGTAGLPHESKAQAEQVRAVSLTRLGNRIGTLNADQLRAVERALRTNLDL